MLRHATSRAALVAETIEALSMHTTKGSLMLLAMTSRELHQAILVGLCKRIEDCVRRPFNRQLVYMMRCPHNCVRNRPTPFVHPQCIKWRGKVVVRCTHCLYAFETRHEWMPSSTWWMTPSHEVMVETILSRMGARHTLLVR
jgi:hypothetical protein